MVRTVKVIVIAGCILTLAGSVCAQNLIVKPPKIGTGDHLRGQRLLGVVYPRLPAELAVEDPALKQEIKKAQTARVNHQVFDALYNPPKVDEKKIIRNAWKQAFGIDVWYPYYKARELEDWVKNRLGVKIFKLKGRPEFENKQVRYIFKTNF